MAPEATLHPVKVLGCDGGGSTRDILAGLNWVAANAPAKSVVNLSLRGSRSAAMNSAVRALVDRGMVVAVASGNDGDDSCDYSPGSEPSALTVGAIDSRDREADYSNYGKCVDLFAPGDQIRSTDFRGGSGSVESGTSMAAPHVSGAAAVLWSTKASLGGARIQQTLLAQATRDSVKFPLGSVGLPERPALHRRCTRPRRPGQGQRRRRRWSRRGPLEPCRVEHRRHQYTVSASPGGAKCKVTNRTSCRVRGLDNGTAYRFSVRARNVAGTGPSIHPEFRRDPRPRATSRCSRAG